MTAVGQVKRAVAAAIKAAGCAAIESYSEEQLKRCLLYTSPSPRD